MEFYESKRQSSLCQVETLWENAWWVLVSHAGRKEDLMGTHIHFAFFPPGSPSACYSPSSPVQVLEDSTYFSPDFQLYSGRHETSALTVEATSSIREKVGKSFYRHLCWKSKMILRFSSLALLHNSDVYSLILFFKSSYWIIDCLFIDALFLIMFCYGVNRLLYSNM